MERRISNNNQDNEKNKFRRQCYGDDL